MPTISGTLQAVYTDAVRQKYVRQRGGITSPLSGTLSFFRVGVGGYLPNGMPRTPDPSLTNLDVLENPGHYASVPATPSFQKSFVAGDIVAGASTNLISINCELDPAEYNSDGTGFPDIGEIGVFDSGGTMVLYATFNRIEKTALRTLTIPLSMAY